MYIHIYVEVAKEVKRAEDLYGFQRRYTEANITSARSFHYLWKYPKSLISSENVLELSTLNKVLKISRKIYGCA